MLSDVQTIFTCIYTDIAVPNNEYNKKVSVMSLDLYLYKIFPHNGLDGKL